MSLIPRLNYRGSPGLCFGASGGAALGAAARGGQEAPGHLPGSHRRLKTQPRGHLRLPSSPLCEKRRGQDPRADCARRRELWIRGVCAPQVQLAPRVFPKPRSAHHTFARSNHETVINTFCEQTKPQGGCFKLPECNAVSGEAAGFNGSINFCETLKTSAILLLCFLYEVNNFCLFFFFPGADSCKTWKLFAFLSCLHIL